MSHKLKNKNKKKSLPGNYRPISLTSVVWKLMETVIRNKIVTFLEENKIIKDSQRKFRKRHSCLPNLLDFFYGVCNSYDETKAVDIIFFDFQKAFDTVPHKRLISKVKAHGIFGNTLKTGSLTKSNVLLSPEKIQSGIQ